MPEHSTHQPAALLQMTTDAEVSVESSFKPRNRLWGVDKYEKTNR